MQNVFFFLSAPFENERKVKSALKLLMKLAIIIKININTLKNLCVGVLGFPPCCILNGKSLNMDAICSEFVIK